MYTKAEGGREEGRKRGHLWGCKRILYTLPSSHNKLNLNSNDDNLIPYVSVCRRDKKNKMNKNWMCVCRKRGVEEREIERNQQEPLPACLQKDETKRRNREINNNNENGLALVESRGGSPLFFR